MKNGTKIAIILLIIGFVSTLGYIIYDKVIVGEQPIEEVDTTKEDYDVKSLFVQDLYHKVTDNDGTYKYWMYVRSTDNSITTPDNYILSEVEDQYKMNFIGINLDERYEKNIDCTSSIPVTQQSTYTTVSSVCSTNSGVQTGYDKDYIEKLYQTIFGSDAKLDTTLPFKGNNFGTETYYYVASIDKYVKYLDNVGGTAAESYAGEPIKATRNGNTIVLVEKVTHHFLGEDGTDQVEELQYDYTFEKDKEENYTFISRVKEETKENKTKK